MSVVSIPVVAKPERSSPIGPPTNVMAPRFSTPSELFGAVKVITPAASVTAQSAPAEVFKPVATWAAVSPT